MGSFKYFILLLICTRHICAFSEYGPFYVKVINVQDAKCKAPELSRPTTECFYRVVRLIEMIDDRKNAHFSDSRCASHDAHVSKCVCEVVIRVFVNTINDNENYLECM